MTSQPMTHTQATQVAAAVHALRPDWDEPGIVDALGRARNRGSGPELAVAAIRAGADQRNRTPAVIALDGAHWRPAATPVADSRPGPDISRRCNCGVLHPDRLDCPGPPAADVQAHANRIRALLTAGRTRDTEGKP